MKKKCTLRNFYLISRNIYKIRKSITNTLKRKSLKLNTATVLNENK